MTPLHWAARTANDPLILALLPLGASIHARDLHDNTPLTYAVLKHSTSTVRLLLNAGADPNAARRNGTAALHIAARQNYVTVAAALLEHGADPNAAMLDSGETPLHLAVASGARELVGGLLQAGADPRIQLPNGDTALHLLAMAVTRNRNLATLDSRIEIMLDLLQTHNTCQITNENGETPLDIVGDDFMRSTSLDLCVIVRTFLEMKLKQSERTVTNLLQGIASRNKHYPNTLPGMLPFLNPQDLVVRSVKPFVVELQGAVMSFLGPPPRVRYGFGANGKQAETGISQAAQFLRQSRMLCEVGCVPPPMEKIEGLADELQGETDTGLSSADKACIAEAVGVWRGYAAEGPSLQTLARNAVRRAMHNIRQETFFQLPVPPRIRDYVAMAELRNLEY
jgi:hypothetical protein